MLRASSLGRTARGRAHENNRGQSIYLLFDAVALLTAEGIDYAVIGALAASVHGAVRGTADADAVLSITVKDLRALEKKFRNAGFTAELREGDLNDPIPAILVLTDTYENQVDLLGGLRGLDRETFSRSVIVPFDKETLKVIGREDFIATKVFAGGPQHLEDARFAIDVAVRVPGLTVLMRAAVPGSPGLHVRTLLIAFSSSTSSDPDLGDQRLSVRVWE